jgi:hypothetical protein
MPKKVKVTGGLRKLHSEEHHNLYSSSSILWIIKNRMRTIKYVARNGPLGIVGLGIV